MWRLYTNRPLPFCLLIVVVVVVVVEILALHTCVARVKMPRDVKRARPKLPQLRVHHVDGTSVWLPRATGVKRPQGVDDAAEVAEVTSHTATEPQPPVARPLHHNDVTHCVTARRKRLGLAELGDFVTRQGEPRRTCRDFTRTPCST